MLCGLPTALSLMVREAVSDPAVAGVNVTVKEHLAFTASEVPQVLLSVKSLLFAPLLATVLRVKAALPVLVRVTVLAGVLWPTTWFPNAMEVDDSVTLGSVVGVGVGVGVVVLEALSPWQPQSANDKAIRPAKER